MTAAEKGAYASLGVGMSTATDDRYPVCPCCANGRPICVDKKPDGCRYTHDETCATYRWADDLCADCDALLFGKADDA